jgi:hypothetical protein
LLDRIEHEHCTYIHRKIHKAAFNQHLEFDDYEDHAFGRQPNDLLYDDENFKVYVVTKEGIKRNKRVECGNVIEKSFETGEIGYCEI